MMALAAPPASWARLPARPSARPQPRARALSVRVMAAAGGGGAAGMPPPEPVPTGSGGLAPAGSPYLRTPTPAGGSGSGAGAGAGTGAGNTGGFGGTFNRPPVGTGGSGGGDPNPSGGGFSLDRILLIMLGIALAVPAWRYLNRRFINKPEPEHVLTKVEDAAADAKHRGTVSKVVSSVKHATVDPVRDTVNYATHGAKHSDAARAAQHKGEDVKDSVHIGAHDAGNKLERGASKTKTGAKHAAEDAGESARDAGGKLERGFSKAKSNAKHFVEDATEKAKDAGHKVERGFSKAKTGGKHAAEDAGEKAKDVGASVDNTAHKAHVKGSRGVQRAGDEISDAAYDAEQATGKATKGVLESVKGAATAVGRKLHVVADATEKGTKKAANKAERKAGVRFTPGVATSSSERRRVYYISGGVALSVGLGVALYYWDKKGGDLGGKVRKLQDRTKEVTDNATRKAKEVFKGNTQEPAGPNV